MATLRSVLKRLRGERTRSNVEQPAVHGEADDADAYRKLRVGFTAAASHELRTPLARLLALLESGELPGAEPRALLERVRVEVERMRELVNDLLFLSEVEAGADLGSAASAVLPVLDEVVEARAQEAQKAGLEFVVVAAPDAQVPLRPRLLRTVVENLVDNVLRHATGATRCWLAARREGGRVLVSVVDNGPGVDDTQLERIFERFYRGDESRASLGSGLGLSIAKHVVTAAGGEAVALPGPGGVGLEIRCSFTTP